MRVRKRSDVEDQIIQDNQLLLAFLDFHLELFVRHSVHRLIEFDRIFPQETLMEELEDGKKEEEVGDRHIVEYCINIAVESIRVNSEKDRDLTRNNHQISEDLQD